MSMAWDWGVGFWTQAHTRAPEPDAAYGRRCPAAIYGAKEPGKPTTCHVYVSEQARWFMLDDP